ncbi:MAG: hypothetical protein ABSH16_10205, partial [Sedimentisphaerales bacterium]
SHDVYFGTSNPPPFKINQTATTYDTGTMDTNTTYYWRIDEKNAGGTTTGNLWSFTTVPPAPYAASNPNPANAATDISLTQDLTWTAGNYATSHDVYFGTASTPPFIANQAGTSYAPGTLSTSTTYYWRIDEKNAGGTTTGNLWSFTTVPPAPGTASNPNPANAATDISLTQDLSWTAGNGATSHDVYFGTSNPPPFKINQTATTYDTGTMDTNTTYYWRIDEKNAGGTTTGNLWSFKTISLYWFDGFESGNFTTGGWSWSNSYASVAAEAAYTGTYGAKLKATTWIQKAISTVGFNTIHVKYRRATTGFDAGENLYVEWSINGSTWNNLETIRNASYSDGLQDKICGSGADNNANFRIRFRTNANSNLEYAYIDDVEIACE